MYTHSTKLYVFFAFLLFALPAACDDSSSEEHPSDDTIYWNVPICQLINRVWEYQTDRPTDTQVWLMWYDWSFFGNEFRWFESQPKTGGEYKDRGGGQYSISPGLLHIYKDGVEVRSMSPPDGYLWASPLSGFYDYDEETWYTLSFDQNRMATNGDSDFSKVNCSVNCCVSDRLYSVSFPGWDCQYVYQKQIPAAYEIIFPKCVTDPDSPVSEYKADCHSSLSDLKCRHGTDENCDGCSCFHPWQGGHCDNCPSLGCTNGAEQENTQCQCLCKDGTFWEGERCEVCGLQNATQTHCQWYGITGHGYANSACTKCNCAGQWYGPSCDVCALDCGTYGEPNDDCTACVCENSWQGANCQTCPVVCSAGAITKDCTGCVCPGLWSGSNCDVCAVSCNGHGHMDTNCSTCICSDGWQGQYCQQKCGNGILEGTEICESPVGCSQSCNWILAGYTCTNGLNCRDVDECADPIKNNCHHLATCVNDSPGYHCVCPPQPTRCTVKEQEHGGEGFVNAYGEPYFGLGMGM